MEAKFHGSSCPDRVVVTFQDVPKNYSVKPNSFQIEMFFDGTLRLTIWVLPQKAVLVGLSRGGGTPAEFAESNLNGLSSAVLFESSGERHRRKDTDRIAP